MRFEIPFSDADIIRATNIPRTSTMLANATFESVRIAFNYWVFHLRGALQALLNPTTRERTTMTLLYRAIGYLASIRRLNSAIHVQSVSGAARSLFEIGLDLALLHQDRTNNAVEPIAAFTTVERFCVAVKTVEYFANHAVPNDYSIEQQRRLVTDPARRAEVEQLILNHWGRNRAGDLNWPKHWSTFHDARGRARAVGDRWEERYVREYYQLSWHIHSGLTGVADLPARTFEGFASIAYKALRRS